MDQLQEVANADGLAFVGVAKNCGKTTTLNALLQWRTKAPPALLSIGIDGESEDVLLGTAKPPMRVVTGQWIVTAQKTALRSTARLEYVHNLGIETPLGDVLICRARSSGEVVLAGLRHRQEVLKAKEALSELGCEALWVDGAYGRVAGAHPTVADQVVISTGAVVAPGLAAVVERTADMISRLRLDEIEDEAHRRILQKSIDDDRVYLVDGERGAVTIPSRSALVGLAKARDLWSESVRAVAIPGVVSDRVAEELLAVSPGRTLLIPDGTTLHLDRRLWRRLADRWQVRAMKTIAVVALSYNPTSVTGSRFEATLFHQALKDRWPDLPIFNPEFSRG